MNRKQFFKKRVPQPLQQWLFFPAAPPGVRSGMKEPLPQIIPRTNSVRSV